MSVFYFPRESYFKRNYKLIYYNLSKSQETYFVVGDWLDLYQYPSNIDLGTIYIKLNDSSEIPLSFLPVTSPFSKIEVINKSEVNSGIIVFLVGEEFFKRDKQSVEITSDKTKYADFIVLRVTIEPANGGYPPPVQVSNDPSYRDTVVLIADKGNTDIVWVGNSPDNLQIPLPPGASMTVTKTSLNKIYVVSSTPGQIVYVFTGGA